MSAGPIVAALVLGLCAAGFSGSPVLGLVVSGATFLFYSASPKS